MDNFNFDILLTHNPYIWCEAHNRMELFMTCTEILDIIERGCKE